MISQKSINEIFETARVEDVVGEFVNLKKRGVNLIGLCPFHNEKTPSFTVSPAKNIYKCFGCGEAGSSVNFLMEHEQLSYPDSLRYLAKKYNLELEETISTVENDEERELYESLYLINAFASKWYQDQLFDTDKGRSAGLGYFKERGFLEESVKKFGLGFAPASGDEFVKAAKEKGYKLELLKKAGLVSQHGKDFFRNRVLFTIHNLTGKVLGFGGRILESHPKSPKYINTAESEIYNKSKVLYGIYFAKKAIRKEDTCYLVEGYTDVLSLHQNGIENVVASSGTALTVDQIRLIKRFTQNITILYDGDPAGIKAALRGLDLVLEQDMNVKIVLLPEGEDPDSYLTKSGATKFTNYITEHAADFILFKTNLLLEESKGDPVKKTALINDIVDSMAKIADPIKRSVYIKECAIRMDVNEQVLVNAVNKRFQEDISKKRQSAIIQESKELLSAEKDEEFLGTGKKGGPLTDEYQERDVVRLLILFGEEAYENEISVSQYILANMEEIMEEFDHVFYKEIIEICLQRIRAKEPAGNQFFLSHPNKNIRDLAITFHSSPYEYSPNWEVMFGIGLQTQKTPEKNFKMDTAMGVNRFKFKKIIRLCEKNKEKLSTLEPTDVAGYMKTLKVQKKLQELRMELGKLTGTVGAIK